MYEIEIFKVSEPVANIDQIRIQRDWMDETYKSHAYRCFPVSLTNGLGWGISFPEDISFVWDGISDTSPNHIKILEGEKYCSTGRSNATVTFNTGLAFKTPENVTLLSMPVPNQFIDGAQAFTTLLSTSFFHGEFPIVWRVTRPMTKITIPANTPIVSIVPISLGEIQDSTLIFKDRNSIPVRVKDGNSYGIAIGKLNKEGKWSNFYRNATDHLGNIIGKHEVKNIRMLKK